MDDNFNKAWRKTRLLQSVMVDCNGVKGVAMCDLNSDHASQYCAHRIAHSVVGETGAVRVLCSGDKRTMEKYI